MVASQGKAPPALPILPRKALRGQPGRQQQADLTHQQIVQQILASPQTKSKILVLDVDETLVHTVIGVHDDSADIQLQLPTGPASVFKRPGVEHFLLTASEQYEIWLWSTGAKCYIDALIDQWEILQSVVSGRYKTMDDCATGRTPKPLFHFEDSGHCDMKDIVLIDNGSHNFVSQESNCIKVKDFTNEDSNDDTLKQLSPILDELIAVDDVRTVLPTLDPPSASDDFGLLMREKRVLEQVRTCKGGRSWTQLLIDRIPCGGCRGCSGWTR